MDMIRGKNPIHASILPILYIPVISFRLTVQSPLSLFRRPVSC
jgi:hypothetical protein